MVSLTRYTSCFYACLLQKAPNPSLGGEGSPAHYFTTDFITNGGHGDLFRIVSTDSSGKVLPRELIGKVVPLNSLDTQSEIESLKILNKEGVHGVIHLIDVAYSNSNYSENNVGIRELANPAAAGGLSNTYGHGTATLIMKEYKNGDVFDLISHSDFPVNNTTMCMYLLQNIVPIVHDCHLCGVYHLDIKPENILLQRPIPPPLGPSFQSHFSPILIDFGSAWRTRQQASGSLRQELRLAGGTYSYSAPELLCQRTLSNRFPLDKADVWSIGALLYAAYFKDLIDPHRKDVYLNNIDLLDDENPVKEILTHTLADYCQRWSINELHKKIT